uniref:Uncharacterized protein n=1 Tax=Timema poppense TaxID=170557 RepID=A0A7R9DG23_TIMPO|nr:unnamed protein product [Timema poppensis]
MDKGSCFGLGEDMQDRRVIAVSKVECLLIPQYWIMQHNRANIWVRIRQFLDQNIPSQVQIFKAFLEHRKWLQYKQELVKEIVSRKKIPNNTTIHDVPYSLRINSDTIPDRPLALSSASLKPILWVGGREGERRGVAPQPTKVSFRANNNRWITETIDGASYRTGLDIEELIQNGNKMLESTR